MKRVLLAALAVMSMAASCDKAEQPQSTGATMQEQAAPAEQPTAVPAE